ncbi:YrhC family protein [Neobacillus sp. YIM B06451]|uniref:YrhC family protein n=1 Tax=Neobacillus sp. YIM B06451 TaxID=3070994 RepID=UPI00292E0758|nr:YrhC family protein [Neobacillus sp. YIM B06451]
MHLQAKELFEKMTDTKWFGIVLLATGSFFYIGAILPTASANVKDAAGMTASSLVFLGGSILAFLKSKEYREQLMEHEDGEEYFQ